MIDFINDILTRLRTLTSLSYVAVYNQQYERIGDPNEDGENGYLFAMPAAFVEFDLSQVKQLGQDYQLYEPVIVRVHIVMNELDAQNGYLDQNLNIIALKNEVLLKLQRFRPTQGSELIRTSEMPDYGHTNLYVWKQEYTTTFVDKIAKDPIGGIVKYAPQSFSFFNFTQDCITTESDNIIISEIEEYIIPE